MQVLVVAGPDDRVRVAGDAELLQQVVYVGVELRLSALIQNDEHSTSALHVLLEGLELLQTEHLSGTTDDEKFNAVKGVELDLLFVDAALPSCELTLNMFFSFFVNAGNFLGLRTFFLDTSKHTYSVRQPYLCERGVEGFLLSLCSLQPY